MMRVFIGINFTEDIKDHIMTIEEEVRKNSVKGDFTLKNNLHLTLRYIGEVDYKRLFSLKKIVTKVATDFPCFTFKVNGVDEFKRSNSSIVFADVEKTQELENLYQIIDKELKEVGFNLDGNLYTPHITLGREVQYKLNFVIQNFNYQTFDIQANKLTLFESNHIKGVLTYIPILELNLKD